MTSFLVILATLYNYLNMHLYLTFPSYNTNKNKINQNINHNTNNNEYGDVGPDDSNNNDWVTNRNGRGGGGNNNNLNNNNNNLVNNFGSNNVMEHRGVRRTFQWSPSKQTTDSCRNTVQGPKIITDERGYTCNREHVDSKGCCKLDNNNNNSTSFVLFQSCRGCLLPSNCCSTFEYCVSCCLRPEKTAILEAILKKTKNLLFSSVTDTFELCLAKCRTSSSSVVHENAYINQVHKYCLGSEDDVD